MKVSESSATFFRSFVFGVGDALTSTVGFLAGIAVAGVARHEILLSGVVLIVVEAISMSTGNFLSEEATEEYERHHAVGVRTPLEAAAIMFFSYLVAGFVPIAPYIFAEPTVALWHSVAISVAALAALGIFSGALARRSIVRVALRMTIVGGVAVVAGVLIGVIFS